MKNYLFVYLGSAFLALVITPVVIWLAQRLSIADYPNLRYVRSKPVPHIGGVAIILSMMPLTVCVLLLSNVIGEAFRAIQLKVIVLISAATFMFFVGLIDDIKGLRARIKFLAQLVAAIAVCAVGIRIRAVAVADWLTLDFGWLSWPLTMLWIVGVTNAVNLSDGLDGLAAGISAVACGVIAVFAVYIGQPVMAVLMLAMLGSLTGFLFFNFNPAKIFMGDCGSMFLGFTIASSSVLCSTTSSALVGLALPVLALGVPIFDTMFSMLRRFLERRSMFAPDRRHFHHRLIDLGFKQRKAVITMYIVTLFAAGLGMLMIITDSRYSIIIFLSILILLLLTFRIVGAYSIKETIDALRRTRSVAYQAEQERNNFERIDFGMRGARSFDSWWQTLCQAAELFGFSRIAIAERERGDKTYKRIWRKRELHTEIVQFISVAKLIQDPFSVDHQFELEIEAPTGGSLEDVGRRTTLFGRLVDELTLTHEKTKFELKSGEKNLSLYDLSFGWKIPTLAESTKEIQESADSTQTAWTSVCLSFDDSIPDQKMEKFLVEIEEAVESRRKSSPHLGDRGVD